MTKLKLVLLCVFFFCSLNKTKSLYIQTLIKVGKEQQVKQFVKVLSEALNR